MWQEGNPLRSSSADPALDRTQTLVPSPEVPGPAPVRPPAPRPQGDDRYQLLAEHGRGGLGRVVRAHDRYLGRTVAVKELLRTSELGERLFLREAMITARLEHPGIVPVHEAGRWPNGDPFYVMKLVSGRTLKAVMAAAGSLGDRLALLPHLIAVADAVGYAHSEGVVHRDLKPTNVLVGDFGETVVIDWGLARDLRAPDGATLPDGLPSTPGESTPAPTVTGRVIGTPQYMAPEQARGEAVGTTADVYAVGAMLYELLAGHPPIEGPSVQHLLDQVRSGPPAPLAACVSGVPADLEAIVVKAMARAPEDRYPTARELAADLKRFQTGQLVTAQRYGRWRLLRRWLVRNRTYVGMAAMALVATGVVAAGMLRSVFDDRRHAQQQRAQAEAEKARAVAGENKLILAQARGSLATDPTTALAWIKHYPVSPVTAATIRGLVDEAEAAGVATQAWRIGDDGPGLALAPDGAWVASGGKDGYVTLRDTTSGGHRRLGDGGRPITALAVAPDSATVYVGGADGQVRRIDVASGRTAPIDLGQFDGPIAGLAVVADGTLVVKTPTEGWRQDHDTGRLVPLFAGTTPLERLALAGDDRTALVTIAHGADGKIRMWRAGVGPTVIATVAGMPAKLAVSADGRKVVVATSAALHLLDVPTGVVRHLADLPAEVNRIAIDPTQRRAAIVTKGPDVFLLDLATGALEVKRGHTDGVYTAAFDGQGERMVTASDDGTVRIWDLPTGDVRELRGHKDDVVTASISRDGRTVLSTSLDDTMRVWRIDDRRTTVVGHLDDVRQIAPLGDDRVRVLTAGHGVQIVDVDLRARQATVQLDDPAALTVRSAMSADGQVAFMVHGPRDVVQWKDGATRPLRLPPTGPKYTFARNGGVLGVDLDGRVWRQDGARTMTIAHASAGASVVADPAGDTAVIQDRTGFRVIDTTTGAEVASATRLRLGVADGARAWFVRGDCRIAIGGMSDVDTGGLRLWDPGTGAITPLADSEHAPLDLMSSPDGRWLVGGVEKRALRLWDARTGAVVRTLGGHRDGVFGLAFSPDGQRLASASYDRTVRVWELATGESRVLSGHVGPVWGVTWLGRDRVASASADGTVRLWSVPPLPPPDLDQLRHHLAGLTAVVIDREPTAGELQPSDARPAIALSPEG